MKKMLLLTAASSLMLAGCGDKAKDAPGEGGNAEAAAVSSPAEKRQPGSWSQKIEIVKLEGDDVKPGDKEQMQQMFSMLSGMTICLTPEAAAKEDMEKKLSDMGTRGENCTFDKRAMSGNKIDFSATCQGTDGKVMKMAATGTSGATSQDITMSISAKKADGTDEGEMVMHIQSERKGECGPKDITPPAAGAETAKS
jgi:hypothetical protein